MAPDQVSKWQITGTVERCWLCSAPMVDPLPPLWTLNVRGPLSDARLMPHLPDCARSPEVASVSTGARGPAL